MYQRSNVGSLWWNLILCKITNCFVFSETSAKSLHSLYYFFKKYCIMHVSQLIRVSNHYQRNHWNKYNLWCSVRKVCLLTAPKKVTGNHSQKAKGTNYICIVLIKKRHMRRVPSRSTLKKVIADEIEFQTPTDCIPHIMIQWCCLRPTHAHVFKSRDKREFFIFSLSNRNNPTWER